MFSVKAKKTMRFAEPGNPRTPQFTIYKDRIYTVAQAGETQTGTMPAWAAKSAGTHDVLTLIEGENEKENNKKEKHHKSKHKKVEE